jgi:hypothetical protein
MSENTKREQETKAQAQRVGHETDVELARLMDERAQEDGPAGVPDEQTIADDAPPVRMAKEAAKVRIGTFKGELAEKRVPLRRKVAETPGRVRQKLAGAALQANALALLKQRLRECRADLPYLSEVRDALEAKIAAVPFYRRGLTSVWVVVAVLAAVAVFDGAVMKSALDQTALDTTSIWFTTIGIAGLFAAINEAFGLLLGVVVRRAGPKRIWIVVGVLAIGLIGLFASIAILGWFRHEVAVSQNQSLNEIAAGHEASFDFIIDPLFLAPLQAVGCIAAMAVVALYTLSSDWRALHKRLKEATATIAQNDADIVRIEGEIAAAHEAGHASFLQAFDAEAEASAAQAEIACGVEQEEAMVDAETALGEEMAARYRGERNFQKRIYDNGKVHRAARPTEFGRRSTHTPDACDIEVDIEAEKPETNGNGHDKDVDPEQLFFGRRDF